MIHVFEGTVRVLWGGGIEIDGDGLNWRLLDLAGADPPIAPSSVVGIGRWRITAERLEDAEE